jgi:uncharacterized protein YcfJ
MQHMTKFSLTLFVLAAASLSQAADFEAYARVISVTPRVEQVNHPRQECHTEYVNVQRQQRSNDVSGGIIGGIVGGLLGNQVGGGNGRTAATAAGAITGALVGDRMQNQDNNVTTSEQPVRQCRTVDSWEQRTVGYQVTYEYAGRTQTSMMSYDPGQQLRLQVTLTPR